MKVAGKAALITGASRGIGRAVARELAARGCLLLLTGREPDELGGVARDLTRRGARVSARPADLLDRGERRELLSWIRDAGPIDLLVNNAGCGRFAPFALQPWADIDRVLQLDAWVPARLIHALLPELLERPEAAIVNVSSASARIPYPGLAAYAASKAFISSLSQTLATELADTSVRVLCVHPGFTRTDFFESAGMDMRRVPSWAIGSPERVARKIARMLVRDDPWGYADLATPIELGLAAAIPHRLRPRVFRRLFWDLPATRKGAPNAQAQAPDHRPVSESG